MTFLVLSIIIIHALIPLSDGACLIIRIIVGLLGLIFLPGFALTIIALDEKNANVGFSLILGFLLQLFNVYAIWAFHIFYGPLNFVFLVYVLTIIEVVSLIIVSYKRKLTLGIDKLLNALKTDKDLVVLVFVYLALAFYWQQWAPAPHSDGAAYLDMARNVVEKGSFRSNMLFPTTTWSYVEYSSGMHIHMFGYFAIALFFLLGNISLVSGKIMLIFTGLLIILVVYELARELFNTNVARLAALITAVSPEILTHVGLVGGPEIPSALFTIFAIYLLIKAPTSKRKLSLGSLAGLSLFVAWYAWYFNFFVFATFLPFLFIYVSMKNREFNVRESLMFLTLLLSFIVEWRLLLNLFYAIIGVQIPSLIIAVSALTYLYYFKKEKAGKTLLTFTAMMLVLYSAFYSRVIVSDFIPQLRQFVASVQPGIKVVTSNVERDIGVLSRAFSLEEVNKYWSMYWDGVYGFLGIVVVFLGFVALARIDKIKETALILSFPLLQALWWGLFVTIDGFQPRYIACSSLFYFVLAASAIEMIYSRALVNLTTSSNLSVNIKLKMSKKITHLTIDTRRLLATFVLVLLMVSFFNFTYPIYDKHKKVMEGWNYSEKYDWSSVFEWITANTSPQDVIASRYSYFPWYVDRPTVVLSPAIYPSMDVTSLVEIIRNFKVRYLVVEQTLAWHQKGLSLLYYSPTSFLGAEIVYNKVGPKGYRTVIYNVTKIAFGKLIKERVTIDRGESLKFWQPFTYYGNGSLSLDAEDHVEGNFSIKVTFTTKNLANPSIAITFAPQERLDLSTFTYLTITMKISEGKDVAIKLATDDKNYFTASSDKLVFGSWFNVTIPIASFQPTLGNPSMGRISFLQIYVRGLEPSKTYHIWIDGITAQKEEYYLNFSR
jgi:hypothetical protein